ncbi:hypothetical protein S40293_00141 [Stachybotrys chartarum IBT 40293]|nr:hypothetical protein S40293_00141 [Stachybotrys chartarum IBT 40293]
MYPHLPKSEADLVPLPQVDGPKLTPFKFKDGQQKIEFLDYLGWGLHSHVFKVRIEGNHYALKLFRFIHEDTYEGYHEPNYGMQYVKDDCMGNRIVCKGLLPNPVPEALRKLVPFYNYSDPFNRECRAFGRIQEAGLNGTLSIECFGYVLLDEDHERTMMDQFSHEDLDFLGEATSYWPIDPALRSRFVSSAGKLPPIRGIVKEFGQNLNVFTTLTARYALRDTKALHRIGIFGLDARMDQLLNYRPTDFSVATTLPHYLFSPELIPSVSPDTANTMEERLFYICLYDYEQHDLMVFEWEQEPSNEKGNLGLTATALRDTSRRSVSLRRSNSHAHGGQRWTYVDPRGYASEVASAAKAGGQECAVKHCHHPRYHGISTKVHAWIGRRPPRWDLDNSNKEYSNYNSWQVKDGIIYPYRRNLSEFGHPDWWNKETPF